MRGCPASVHFCFEQLNHGETSIGFTSSSCWRRKAYFALQELTWSNSLKPEVWQIDQNCHCLRFSFIDRLDEETHICEALNRGSHAFGVDRGALRVQ
jgi:hypothetical protein